MHCIKKKKKKNDRPEFPIKQALTVNCTTCENFVKNHFDRNLILIVGPKNYTMTRNIDVGTNKM